MKCFVSSASGISRWSPSMRREWIEIILRFFSLFFVSSPSMRREWIEIPLGVVEMIFCRQSPSMRREWIEMRCGESGKILRRVSLHAEGVD